MTRALLVSVVLLTGHAFADIPPDNSSQCQSSTAGSACTTDDGAAGTCVAQMVGRLDYSDGVPPKTKQVQMLICVASAPATVRAAPPFLAAGLVMLAMLALIGVKLAGRGRRSATA
ncbi:MAG: hypothetical protein Q8L14_00725 [Myxococcales bacterium]|nr:hypothetical protein [Myxococcales bacterium]